jgi:ELWxxDGT repeat protein
MWLKELYQRWAGRPAVGRRLYPLPARRRVLRPSLEQLEDRTVPSAGTAADTVLVKDILAGSVSSSPSNLTDVNGKLFFTSDDGVSGMELWKSDGTAAGTVLVKDISPGSGSSSPRNLTNVNGTLFFLADDGTVSGWGVWKSDGTAAGTVLIKHFPSPQLLNPSNPYSHSPHNLTDVNGTLFFAADDGQSGEELWKSDGTTAGTVLVKDIYPKTFCEGYGGYSSSGCVTRPNSSNPSDLTNLNGRLFFTANTGKDGGELWKSDGTANGTKLVKDINPGKQGSNPNQLTNVNGTLFFWAHDGTSGGLWKSDGTSKGTVLVKEISFDSLTNVNGTLFFSAYDGTSGQELWKSDGTAAGTVLVKDIRPGGFSSYLQELRNVNGTLFFSAYDGISGQELWKSDGTAAGTVLVKDINLGVASSAPAALTVSGGHLFFTADDGVHGRELWDPPVGGSAGVTLDVGRNVNTSQLPFNQQETTIAINPANPSNLFIASNTRNLNQLQPPAPAQFAAYSMNGGKTWKYVDPKDGTVADGDDALTTARNDSSAVFDTFGNLFWAYEHYDNPDHTSSTVVVLLSTDGGKTFSLLDLLRPGKNTDHVFLATGPGPGGSGGSVWVSYLGDSPDQTVVQGAPVTGLGAVGAFSPPEKVTGPGSPGQQIAVGPRGQVLVSINGETQTVTTLDPDGLGPAGFGAPQHVTNVKINGRVLIPAQPHWGIVADAALAYDRSGGPHRGRAYMVYNDAVAMGSADTNIFVRFSDDDGVTWSAPVRANDDPGANSQFFPRIAVDPTTGYIAVSWYDCRNDLGAGGPGDTDGIANDETQFWAAVSTDGGLSFAPNVQVSAGTSSANAAWTGINQDYGDYTALDFYGGKFYPAWADNSNSTGDNPPGAFRYFDIYTAAVTVTVTGGEKLTAAALPAKPKTQTLAATQAQPLLTEAIHRWQIAGVHTSGLGNVQIQIANLGGRTLGLADEAHHTIWLDNNAAGWGWFIDPTPRDDSEFTTPGNQGEQNRMDLLTVLEHEIGHLLDYQHKASGLMHETLIAGTRLAPSAGSDADWLIAVDGLFAEAWSKKRK